MCVVICMCHYIDSICFLCNLNSPLSFILTFVVPAAVAGYRRPVSGEDTSTPSAKISSGKHSSELYIAHSSSYCSMT